MVSSNKILQLDALAGKVAQIKTDGFKVVLCHGAFDLMHIGHLRHFEQARRQGDLLVVTVTPDRFVNKGAHRPVFPETLRAEAIAALSVVDYVAINRWPTAAETIRLLQPNVYCKGGEFREAEKDANPELASEIEAVAEIEARVEFTEDITFSSSHLINYYLGTLPPEAEVWLETFRQQHSVDELIGYLESAVSLKALVVGEAIVDEYVFCDGLGKSTKDPILAFHQRSTEAYAGGSLAVANHLAGFCSEVGLITFLGESERREDFVHQALLPNIQPHFLTFKDAPTIHKRRFVDTHTGARMFELYLMEDGPLGPDQEVELVQVLRESVSKYDIVVVADYGHGMLTPAGIASLCDGAGFLAVNTQANAGNRGFNTIARYARADYVCLAMHEVALETRMRHAHWRELILEISKRIDCPGFTVTQGSSGSFHYTPESGFIQVPALATRVTDRIGAGDAVLAVTSLLVALDAPWEMVGFVGNLAGAQMVKELGNRISVNKESITRHAISLMK